MDNQLPNSIVTHYKCISTIVKPKNVLVYNGRLLTILRILVCLFLTIIWFFSPILSCLFIVSYLYFVRVSKYDMLFCFLLLATIPALVNYTKTPISDLLIYYETYNELWTTDLSNMTNIVKADFLFYLVSAILAKISEGQQQLFVFFWSTLTYFTYFLALRLYALSLDKFNKKVLVGIVFYSLCFGISFNLSGHLVRQFFAASLLSYAIVLYSISNRRYLIVTICAILSHFSALIFVAGFALGKAKRSKLTLTILILLAISIVIGTYNLLDLALPLLGSSKELYILQEVSRKAIVYANDMDAEVTLREWLIMIFFTLLACKLYASSLSDNIRKFITMYFFLIIVLVLTRNNNLLLLRFSYYFDFFASFILLISFSQYWQQTYIRLIFYLLVLAAPFRFIRIISGDSWTYIDNSAGIILNTVISFFSYHPTY